MPSLPKLTPLQSRCAASLAASVVLLVLYLSLTKPQLAYALEFDSRIPHADHNHYMILEDDESNSFEPAADDLGQHKFVARAEAGVSALENNAPQNRNINVGETQNWVFQKDAIDGPHGIEGSTLPQKRDASLDHTDAVKRQSGTRVYITLNTCLQPTSNVTELSSSAAIPPQLQMFISLSNSSSKPGPGIDDPDQKIVKADGGYALYEVDAEQDVYVGVAAPNTTDFSGIWNYEIAASNDAPYHGYHNFSNLYFVDGDNHAALLITNDTTQAQPNETVFQDWMKLRPPWGMFAVNQNDTAMLGVKNSFCGLRTNSRLAVNIDGFSNQNVAQMTDRGLGGKPKEQFYITGLNATSKYWAFLALDKNSTTATNGIIAGGGMVFESINFNTKTEDNCALMYNLSFCSEVAYAVPTNPDQFSPITGLPDLAALYDSHAAQMYQYFNYSLQQIPCNATSSAQYSLARNCDDCARAYKQWLCAVTIPRCADFSEMDAWLKPRNLGQPFANGSSISQSRFGIDQQLLNAVATNSSRNPIIDDSIRPGPYKEVLPCEDLCYDLVQSCPASLGFACPLRGRGLEDSYGKRSNDSGLITCSYLGAAYYLSGADHIFASGFGHPIMLAVVIGLINSFW